jgi:hypothetical protein
MGSQGAVEREDRFLHGGDFVQPLADQLIAFDTREPWRKITVLMAGEEAEGKRYPWSMLPALVNWTGWNMRSYFQ